MLGHEPDRGELLVLRQRLDALIAEIDGRRPRSITPGPGSVNARSLIRAVLRLSAAAWIDVELDDARRIVGIRIDRVPATDEQWLASPPLLLFDAADPANLGWFSRCQFYLDCRTGSVMQTPLTVANKRDRAGRDGDSSRESS